MRSTLEFTPPLTLAFATHEASAQPALASNGRRVRTRCRDGAHSRDRLAGRAAARLAIARASGMSDVGRIVLRARNGMPPAAFLRGARGALEELPIALSITHSAGHAVAAAAPRCTRLGVDLERCGSVASHQLRHFLTPAERREGVRYSPTTLWVLKEAGWKALGCNSGMSFTSLILCFDARGRVTALAFDGRTIGVRVSLLHPWPGFICAVVAVGEPR